MASDRASTTSFSTVLGGQVFLALGAVAMLWLFGRQVNPWGTSPVLDLILGTAGGLLTYLLLLGVSRSRLFFRLGLDTLMQRIYPVFAGYSWMQILAVSLLAGFGEELLFRVLIQDWLLEASNLWVALALSSLLFGIAHFISLSYFLVTTAVGLILGLAYHYSGSAALVIAWHAVYDIVAVAVLAKAPHLLGIDPVQVGSRHS